MSEIPSNDDLLARARDGNRDAVDALVRRFGGLVYGVALRQTRDAQTAADASQAVFMVFVRRVATIRSARALPGWFLQTTRYAAQEAHRSASRRAHHEHRAARAEQIIMDPTANESNADPKLAMLDDAIGSLRKADRDVVLMRYLQGRDVREIAADLGLGEEAARKRISRAVDRMRDYLVARGVVTSADGVTAVLAAAGAASSMPAAVLEACASAAAGGAVAGSAGAVAKGVIYSIGATKLKVAAVTAAAALLVTVGTIAVASATFAPRNRRIVVAPPPTPAAAATPTSLMTKDAAMAELNRAYALPDGQMMRVIQPPFPAARGAWADAEFPYAKGSQNLLSLGFRATPAPAGLQWRYMSYAQLDLDNLVGDVPWYRVEGLERITFPPVTADLVVRDGIGYQEQLEAAMGVVAEFTNVRRRVVKAQATRPCIILKGKTRTPPESRKGFPTLILTQAPLDAAALKRWLSGGRAKGTTHQFQFEPATESLGAPFFFDEPTPRDGADLGGVSLVLIAPDAKLKPDDPQYEAKLRKVLDNIEKQIGGEWRIETRTLDVFRIEPATR